MCVNSSMVFWTL